MTTRCLLPLVLSFLTVIAASSSRCFPSDFLFGSTTAAFQVEGAWNISGRELSIWDEFCRSQPTVECGDVADDFYHRYNEDVQRMSDIGLSSFSFSISWTRIMFWDAKQRKMLPNRQGIAFYHTLLDDLEAKKLHAIVTLYHFDLPAVLHTQLEPKGWLNSEIVHHFEAFAELAFREFGRKVQYWATFNEPLTFISGGYGSCDAPPGDMNQSDINTYVVAHNVLLSHARAVKLFRELKVEKKVSEEARVGIVLNAEFGYPVDAADTFDIDAAERKMQFDLGWFLTPLVTGNYPEIMRKRVGQRLPTFSTEEAAVVKGSYDVLMLNHYYSRLVTDCDSERSEISCQELPLGHARDRGVDDTRSPNAPPTTSEGSWLQNYPEGYLATIKWLHAQDPSTEILLTENGWCGDEKVENQDQLGCFQASLEQVYKAVVEEKIPIIGYTAWSFLDNEWGSYKSQFGLNYVNSTSSTRDRIPRPVAKWFAHVSTTKCLDGWDMKTIEMDIEEEEQYEEKQHHSETNGIDKGVPWSLTEVIILLVIGVVILIAIICGALRELRRSSQNSADELQVLITVEN